jgi:hypothetical protein
MPKKLLHYYFKIRTWWPLWIHILNFPAQQLLRKESPRLTPVQKRIVATLETEGIAVSSLFELFPEENMLEKLEIFAKNCELQNGAKSQSKKKFLLEYWPLVPELSLKILYSD